MDPEANYAEQQRLYGSKDPHDRRRLAELRSALREWIGGGGFKPKGYVGPAWRPTKAKPEKAPKLTTERIHLDRQGYQTHGYAKGKYWGVGAPLFRVFDEEGDEVDTVRASDAKTAKAKVMPKATDQRNLRKHDGEQGYTGTQAMADTAALGVGFVAGRVAMTRYPEGVKAFGQTVPVSVPIGAGSIVLGLAARRFKYRKIGRALIVGGVGAAVSAALPVKTP